MARNFRDKYQQDYGISQQSDEPRPHPGVIVGGEAGREKRKEYAIVFGSKIFGSIAAVWWMFTYDTGWVEWSAFIAGYIILMLGIVLGFHRYYSHKAFDTSVPMQYILGAMAQMSIQSSVLRWAADHRRHHAHSDEIGDVHSPWLDGRGRPTSKLKGMFHSHFGWFMDDCVTDMSIYGKGLADNDVVLWLHKTRWFWLVFSLIIFPGVWGLVFGGWDHVIGTILIGGYFRTFVVLQITLGISSYAHVVGSQRHTKGVGTARNSFIFSLLTFGEGWHNNHHKHPRASFQGMAWWEIDIAGYVLLLLEKMGLVWNVTRQPKYIKSESGEWVLADRKIAPKPANAEA
ncbi:acyl-CoA desaturase [Parasphingorhabdus sp.]|uniref:acyl-CoA desaturase n=1 Tax=Parasphingorhabdus sp. TaxID=2709688 RepID=UPI003A8E8BA7